MVRQANGKVMLEKRHTQNAPLDKQNLVEKHLYVPSATRARAHKTRADITVLV